MGAHTKTTAAKLAKQQQQNLKKEEAFMTSILNALGNYSSPSPGPTVVPKGYKKDYCYKKNCSLPCPWKHTGEVDKAILGGVLLIRDGVTVMFFKRAFKGAEEGFSKEFLISLGYGRRPPVAKTNFHNFRAAKFIDEQDSSAGMEVVPLKHSPQKPAITGSSNQKVKKDERLSMNEIIVTVGENYKKEACTEWDCSCEKLHSINEDLIPRSSGVYELYRDRKCVLLFQRAIRLDNPQNAVQAVIPSVTSARGNSPIIYSHSNNIPSLSTRSPQSTLQNHNNIVPSRQNKEENKSSSKGMFSVYPQKVQNVLNRFPNVKIPMDLLNSIPDAEPSENVLNHLRIILQGLSAKV